MFARVTPFKMKAASVGAVRAQLQEMKADILALPGMQQFICVMNDDGGGYVVSVISDKATSDANQDKVKALWGRLADHLEAMPVPEGYNVEASWS